MVLIMKLPQEGRLLQEIPFTAIGPSQDLHQGLFFFAFPDLRHDGVTQTALQGLHPQVAIDQDKGVAPLPQNNHRQDLPKALNGTGQSKDPLRPLDPGMGIAKMKLCNLDLFDFSKMSRIHDPLTLDGGIDLPRAPCIHKNDTACYCQTMPWHKS